jgi:hypothetical protein
MLAWAVAIELVGSIAYSINRTMSEDADDNPGVKSCPTIQ